jgi:UDP-N-acetylmuramate dehydrogenase
MKTRSDVALSAYTTLGLGGPAASMVTVYDEDEVVAALRAADGPVLVIGGGSNLVISDDGFAGTAVRIASRGVTITPEGERVRVDVAAGEDWNDLVSRCIGEQLAGVECLAGIPGLAGATPIQNVGAYGQDVSETVASVRAYDRERDEVRTVTDCGFSYRSSMFKTQAARFVVLSVSYLLDRTAQSRPIRYAELARALGVDVGDTAALSDVRDAVLSLRRGKGMVLDPDQLAALRARVDDPPAYPETDGKAKVPAAWLIERAGFAKGDFDGPVGISTKHALALVNRGGARTEDLLRGARAVRDRVRDQFGVVLVPEPVLVGVTL